MTGMEKAKGLPEGFLTYLDALLAEEEREDFLLSFDKALERSVSLNRTKIEEPTEVLKEELGLKDEVEWCSSSYYTNKELPALTSSPYYAAGLFYLQEASAMSPASYMDFFEGMRVLDLSAAPGGKTLQIATALGSKGFLLSNDISVSRQRATLRNIEKYGLSNVAVSAESPGKIASQLPLTFDAILVDAPCSGEGMFVKDRAYMEEWQEDGPKRFQELQLSILESVLPALRPEGYIMYSTCTFNSYENEAVIEAFLKAHPEFMAEELDVSPSIRVGLLPNTYRIWPHRARGLGHFFCKLRRRAENTPPRIEDGFPAPNLKMRRQAEERAAELFRELGALKLFEKLKEGHEFELIEDRLYAVSKLAPKLKGLRLLRNCLLLAEGISNRLQPSQQLAMFMRAEDTSRSLRLEADSDALRRYLLGETLTMSVEEGVVLICLGNYPLGFAKSNGKKLKNLYKKDWIKCLRT